MVTDDVTGYSITDAGNLETALTSAYRKTLRPSDVTKVGVTAGLLHISCLVSADGVTSRSDKIVH